MLPHPVLNPESLWVFLIFILFSLDFEELFGQKNYLSWIILLFGVNWFFETWKIMLLFLFLHKALGFPSLLLHLWITGWRGVRDKMRQRKRCLILTEFDVLPSILPTLTLSVSYWHWPETGGNDFIQNLEGKCSRDSRLKTLSLWWCLSPGKLPVFD